ncbi:mitochondrial distribution and morphology protein 10 [Vararia minispora EC-137]|uniref:Mitochondrial distribution and morphology protein 10 n=1 Tax=Vararia minispora EC-137 TaxID=1314806 RepID=A0ACB8QQW6_9AGAM|nr:mitochondrial distribution and morphology protein 10 [Vararia minispora EC-137]
MHPFATYVLRSYYKATGWNEDNLYSNLTRSSNAILDFTVPRGLHFSISKSPNALFRTTYSMNALPSLNGSVGYIFTSCDLDIKNSGDVRFKDMVERFRIFDQPHKAVGNEEIWLAGKRIDTRDYLLYGRLYVPTGRLDALYSTRFAANIQALVAAISDPRADYAQATGRAATSPSNVMLSLQHDTGRTCTEYTYSAEDMMVGVRLLHNFGRLGAPSTPASTDAARRPKRIDEEDAMEGGLKGRISAGAEIYFSAKEKSAGVSTGIRFTTLPDATPPSFKLPLESPASPSTPPPFSQPPTTITALFNPMLGHISGAYAAQVSRDLSLGSRFDFNVYSYESEWTMGAEWWLRRARAAEDAPPTSAALHSSLHDVTGVVKARVSTSNEVAVMWEGRLSNLLVGIGLAANLSSRAKPIRSLGLELSYFSSS